MKIKYFPALLFLLISPLGYSQETAHQPGFSASINPGSGKKLLQQCSRATPREVIDYWLVSQAGIDSLEQNFSKLDSLTSKDCCFSGRQIKNLNSYGVQYVGIVIKKKKYIYVNAFPKSEIEVMKKHQPAFDPIKNPIIACDGGAAFWGALFDVETKEFSSLSFNGIG